jgi:hypothetical protein
MVGESCTVRLGSDVEWIWRVMKNPGKRPVSSGGVKIDQAMVAARLRALFDAVASEPVPPEFLDKLPGPDAPPKAPDDTEGEGRS